jgi:hypothetical protein
MYEYFAIGKHNTTKSTIRRRDDFLTELGIRKPGSVMKFGGSLGLRFWIFRRVLQLILI